METVFHEKISKHIVDQMEQCKEKYGEDSGCYKALYHQYVFSDKETLIQAEGNLKHYEASLKESGLPNNVERLYRRQLVIELTMVCAAHCRYCLRANYDKVQISKSEIDKIVEYCAKEDDLRELLVTGGDPMLVPQLLQYLIAEVATKAPNISVIRIGTRLPVHDPDRMSQELLGFFSAYSKRFIFEIAVQINHAVELDAKAREVILKLRETGAKIYSQNVLLKNVNDNIEALVTLYDELRYLGVEAHYLFHAVPIMRTNHFRCTVEKGLGLIKQLTSSGMISGRVKPMYSLMTDVGKVTLYEDTLEKCDDGVNLIVKTKYKLEDRLKWNPSYVMPQSAFIDENGCICVKYLDGSDGEEI